MKGGKTGGRKKGTPNRNTAEIRQALQNIYNDNIENIQADLDKMTPFQRQQILDRIATRFLPTLTDNISDVDGSGLSINITYKQRQVEDDEDKNDDDED